MKRLVLLAALVALAPRPAPAQQSSIPDAILGKAPPPQGQTARYLPGDTLTRGYLAVPSGTGPFPALILIHEWNGVVDRVRQVADMLGAFGERLRAGQVIITGSITPPLWVEPGEQLQFDLVPSGSVSVRFAPAA